MMTPENLVSVVSQLHWTDVIFITDSLQGIESDRNLQMQSVLGMVVSGSEAVSGEWVQDVVRTGRDSWRPLHILMMCSLTCVASALTKASQLEKRLGTQSAFGMTSRWLLVETGNDLLDHLDVTNVTMDNVAVIDKTFQLSTLLQCFSDITEQPVQCHRSRQIIIHSLEWKGQGRSWTKIHLRHRDGVYPASTQYLYQEVEKHIFPNLYRGYNGRHLRLLAKSWLSFVKYHRVNGKKIWSGLNVDILHQASLTFNFTYEIVDAEHMEWGKGMSGDSNTSYHGTIIRKAVDVGLASTDIIKERFDVMDFAWVLVFSEVAMVYRNPIESSIWMLFSPLSIHLLLALAGAFIIVTTLLVVIERLSIDCLRRSLSPNDEPFPMTLISTVERTLHVVSAAVLSKPTEVELTSRPAGILLWSWWMLSVVLTAAYSGTLTAFLSVSKHPLMFSSPQDLLTKTHGYKWGVMGNSGVQITIQTVNDSLHSGLWKGIQDFARVDPRVLSTNETALIQKVLTEDFVLFTEKSTAKTLLLGNCSVVVLDASMRNVMSSMVLPKESAFTNPLSDLVLRLHSSGVLSQWRDKWFPQTTCHKSSEPLVISLLHLHGVLLVLSVGLGVALTVLVIETVYHRRRAKST